MTVLLLDSMEHLGFNGLLFQSSTFNRVYYF